MHRFQNFEFIEKLKHKDSRSVEDFVRFHTATLYHQARKLGFNLEETDDIVQLTWITFFDVINKFEGRSSLKTFLIGILYNKASEYRRKNFRLKNSEEINDDFTETFDQHFDQKMHWIKNPINPESFKLKTEILSLIEHCLSLLPIKQKLAFVLKEVDEEETQLICEQLEITNSNLGVLLFRAKNQLRICIESQEGGKNA